MNTIESLTTLINNTFEPKALGELYTKRGKLHHSGNNIQGAINDFNKAIELDSENIEARSFLSYIYEILDYRYMEFLNV